MWLQPYFLHTVYLLDFIMFHFNYVNKTIYIVFTYFFYVIFIICQMQTTKFPS